MLTLVTYSTKEGLRRYLGRREGALRIVAPFPGKADALRAAWGGRAGVQVLTVSRFTQDLFESGGGGQDGAPWRKSRLLLLLNAFKNMVPHLRGSDFGTFKTAYQVFSDLRSYTAAPDIPDELLAPFPPQVRELVELFHAGTQRAGVRDEHAALFDLAEALRAPGAHALPEGTTVVFEGFTFLTPAQLSFFEALAIRHQVLVPVPGPVLRAAHPWDWPKVLELSAHLVEDAGDKPAESRPIPCLTYPAGSLASALRRWRSGPGQVVLGCKRPTPAFLQEIPFADAFVKAEVDVLAEAVEGLFSRWGQRLLLEPGMEGERLREWIQEEKRRLLSLKEMGALRSYKVLTLIEEALTEVPVALQGQSLDSFLLQLLREVVELDSPRNHAIPLLREPPPVRVGGLNELDSVGVGPVALCLSSAYGPIKGDNRPYSPDLEAQLAKLGPVKRPELDFLFVKSALSELLAHPGLTVLMEEGLLDHDLAWKQVFEGRELETSPAGLPSTRAVPDYGFFGAEGPAPSFGDVSASRLQDYFDCPRRYHARRVSKLVPEVRAAAVLDPMERGTLEHALLGGAWQAGRERWRVEGFLEGEAERLLRELTPDKRLTPVQKAAVLGEAVVCARNGLESLAAVERALPGTRFNFESPLTAPGRRGSIDCLGTGGEALVLVDFKRAKGANPSHGAWGDMEKIQLWFYLRALKLAGQLPPKFVVGYFFLKDPSDSWLAANDGELKARLEAEWGKGARDFADWEACLERYAAVEDGLLARLACESVFPPRPRGPQVCLGCELKPLCPGATAEVSE